MLKSQLQAKLEWVERNLPQVAALPPDEVRRIVQQALDLTRGRRVAIGILGAVIGAGAGLIIPMFFIDAPFPGRHYIGIAIACAFVATVIANFCSESILHRKIEFLGLGPS